MTMKKIFTLCSLLCTSSLFFAQCSNFSINVTTTAATTSEGGGSVTICATGGTPEYDFEISYDNGQTMVSFTDTDSCHTFNDRPGGEFISIAVDDNNCSDTTTVTIPAWISGNLNCAGAPALTCGTPFSGNTSTGQNNVESYGCNNWSETGKEKVHTFTPTENGAFSAVLTGYQGDKDVYILSACDPSQCVGNVASDTAYFANAIANTTYYLVVDADDGSSGAYTLQVNCFADPCEGLNLISSSMPVSEGESNGSASVSISGLNNLTATYVWSNNEAGTTIENLSTGMYTVTANISNGCVLTETINVLGEGEPGPCLGVTITPSSTNESSEEAGDGTASVSIQGVMGNDEISYLWNTQETTQALANLSAGNYTVTVSISNGCTLTQSITVGINGTGGCENLALSFIKINETALDANDGSLNATASGGTEPYSYVWNNGSDSNIISNLAPQYYVVTITDANNCTFVDSSKIFSFEDPCALNIVINALSPTAENAGDGSATVLVSGGVPPYEYQWNTGATTDNVSNLATDLYVVNVSDQNGCEDQQAVFLSVLSIQDLTGALSEIKLFPNPANDFVRLSIKSTQSLEGNISISNIQGKVIGKPIITNIQKGLNTFELPISTLPKGMYLVRFYNNKVNAYKTLVK